MTTITQNVTDIAGADDDTSWTFYTEAIRESDDGDAIITPKKIRKYPISGVLTVELDPGPAIVIAADGKHYPFTVPEGNSDLWPLIEAAVTIPPTTTQQKLEAAVAAWLESHPGGGSGDMLAATYDPTGVEDDAFDQDSMVDGTINKNYTASEKTKLAGIATGATANATNAELRDRTTHTGMQTSASIEDFTEAVQDAVAALLAQGTGITLNYDDVANSLTITSSGGGGGGLDAEAVRDAIGIALIGSGLISVSVNDAADTITISTTATVNATDAALRDRATHTGTQEASTILDLTEAVQDVVGAFVTDGGGLDVTYNDAGNAIAIAVTGQVSGLELKNHKETPYDAGTKTTTWAVDVATNGNNQRAQLTASTVCAVTVPAPVPGQTIVLWFDQAASVGAATVTFTVTGGSTISWPYGSTFAMTTAAGTTDQVILTCPPGGTKWRGSYVQGYTT